MSGAFLHCTLITLAYWKFQCAACIVGWVRKANPVKGWGGGSLCIEGLREVILARGLKRPKQGLLRPYFLKCLHIFSEIWHVWMVHAWQVAKDCTAAFKKDFKSTFMPFLFHCFFFDKLWRHFGAILKLSDWLLNIWLAIGSHSDLAVGSPFWFPYSFSDWIISEREEIWLADGKGGYICLFLLTFYHTMTPFNTPEREGFWK